MATLSVHTRAKTLTVPVIVVDTQQASGTWTLDTSMLSGITAYEWRSDGVAIGGATTSATPSLAGREGQRISCLVTHAGGATETPSQKVYMSHADASHNAMDDKLLALAKHEDATAISQATGDWSNAATWHGGRVPAAGDAVLLANGHTVTYDVAGTPPRLHTLRLDGKLAMAQDQSADMLVETIVIDQDGELEDGQSGARLSRDYTHTITFSDRSVLIDANNPTDLDIKSDPMLMGRGLISLGTLDIWAADVRTWRAFKPVQAGATSIELVDDFGFEEAVGWDGLVVGDQIIIGSTDLGYPNSGTTSADTLDTQGEIVTVTGISGASNEIITFANDALVYDHDDRINGRLDCYPTAGVYKGGNIVFTSEEATDPRRKGHFMVMHGMCEVDLWGAVDFINLGRTDKRFAGGVIESGKINTASVGSVVLKNLTARSNTIGRYGGPHFHRTGRRALVDGIKRRECHGIRVYDTVSHGIVHHDGHMNIVRCLVNNWWGGAIVAEQGNETGAWSFNAMLEAGTDNSLADPAEFEQRGNFGNEYKRYEGVYGVYGDNFRYGTGLSLVARNVRNNGNRIHGVGTGVASYHRVPGTTNNTIQASLDPQREDTDWNYIATEDNFISKISYVHSPIRHMDGNIVMGCVHGFEVTKNVPEQLSDHPIVWNDLQVYGATHSGIRIEYVANYIMKYSDLASQRKGLNTGSNLFVSGGYNIQTAVNSPSDENVLFNGSGDTSAAQDSMSVTDPKFFSVGHSQMKGEGVRIDGNVRPANVTNTDFLDITYIDDDWQNDNVDESADPFFTSGVPSPAATWDGASSYTISVSNPAGTKTDNLSTNCPMWPKIWGTNNQDYLVPQGGNADAACADFKAEYGFFKVGGTDTLMFPTTLGDRITGRPAMYLLEIRGTSADAYGGTGDASYNGVFAKNASPLAAPDVDLTCAIDSTVDYDVTTGATGSSGAPSSQDLYGQRCVLRPNYGEISWSGDTVTYTPEAEFEGVDEFVVHIYDDGHYKSRIFRVRVGATGSLPAPIDGTNFAITGGAGQINFELGNAGFVKPNCRPRKPRIAEYSTDNGATWRRLCYSWAQTSHPVTLGSDGVALAAGSYDCQVRYVTNQNHETSAASVAQSITVT